MGWLKEGNPWAYPPDWYILELDYFTLEPGDEKDPPLEYDWTPYVDYIKPYYLWIGAYSSSLPSTPQYTVTVTKLP